MRCTGLAAERGGYFSVRVRELDGEMQPWVDLLRTHSLVPRVGADTPDGGPNILLYHALRPIPRTQMDGTTCCYTQNPGHGKCPTLPYRAGRSSERASRRWPA